MFNPKTTRKVMYQSPAGRFQSHEPAGGVYRLTEVSIIRSSDLRRIIMAANRARAFGLV